MPEVDDVTDAELVLGEYVGASEEIAHDLLGAAGRLSVPGWGHLVFLGVVPAALCYTLWAWVLQTLPMTLVMG